MSDNDRIGVVDIGSNSVKLLILDGNHALHRDSVVTRLGSGLADTGGLAEDSVAVTLQRLGDIRSILDAHAVTNVHAVATAAVRSANNAAPFVAAASTALGCNVTVIDG
ncbi:MAG: Ppx/GppA phosphatase family protein, partial [Actinomycetota bacterium]